eukprot:scaffold12953_cov96-Isochrysis_galbana.AAC.4
MQLTRTPPSVAWVRGPVGHTPGSMRPTGPRATPLVCPKMDTPPLGQIWATPTDSPPPIVRPGHLARAPGV